MIKVLPNDICMLFDATVVFRSGQILG